MTREAAINANLAGGNGNGNSRGWRETALKWLLDQGVVTVLLFLLIAILCYAGYYVVPAHLETITKGYHDSEARFTESIKEINLRNSVTIETLSAENQKNAVKSEERFEKLVDRISSAFDKDQDRDREVYMKLEATRKELDKAREEIERNK